MNTEIQNMIFERACHEWLMRSSLQGLYTNYQFSRQSVDEFLADEQICKNVYRTVGALREIIIQRR